MDAWPVQPLRAVVALLLVTAGGAPADFRAGAARRVITPDLGAGPVWLAGFGMKRAATGVHDDLWVRCAALGDGAGAVILCGVDSIGLFLEDVERARSLVRARSPRFQLVVAATHVHQAPDTMGLWGPRPGVSGRNPDYNRRVVERTAEAALEAAANMRRATLTAARVASPELESFIHDTRPPLVLDAELIVVGLRGRDGRPVATILNWANHPEVLGSRNTLVTADYAGFLYRRIEERGGGIAVLLNGALGGMQSPLGARVQDPATGEAAPEASFRKAELIGVRVAELAAEALAAARPLRVDRVRYEETRVRIPLANEGFRRAIATGLFGEMRRLDAEGALETVVGYLRAEARRKPVLEAFMVPGELYPELSVGGIERLPGADFPDTPFEPPLKSLLSAPFRMLVGMANDEIGYIIPKAEWDEQPPWLQHAGRRWYGEINSVGPEAAPRIAEAAGGLVGAFAKPKE